MENDFEDFISERINHNYNKLRQTKKWQREVATFDFIYNSLYKELTVNQQEKLDRLIESKNSLTFFESCFAYKLAFCDMKFFKM